VKSSGRPKVRKAVIAAAGFGTRLLPQTKAMPKEMLPLVDKPIIQYVVEDLVGAGIEDIIIVTGYHKRSIEDHFDQINADLLANLEESGKTKLIEQLKEITTMANFAFVRQHKGPYGSARPILNTGHLIGDEPFIYAFADDLIVAEPNRFSQMIELYEQTGGIVLPAIRVDKDDDFDKYGIIDGGITEDGAMKISNLVEKPGKAAAPSNLASVGGYLLTPDVFKYTESGLQKRRHDQEFYLTTFVLEPMIEDGKELFACEIMNGRYYDTGNQLGYLKTVVDFALMHDELKDDFAQFLRDRMA
jgi:UTP--glucose-1-phosphate uridylyltransferase